MCYTERPLITLALYIISGFVFHYTLMQVSLWWFFNVIVLFWKMVFPFHAKSFEKAHGFKHLHITAVILGVVLPLIPVISMIATGGFVMGTIPPVVCYTRDPDITFYSVILPINVMVQIGMSLLVITFWTIHKVYPQLISSTLALVAFRRPARNE